MTVIFNQSMVGEDTHVVEVLRLIGHNQLIKSLAVIDFALGMEFLYKSERWMIEEINGCNVTASNLDDNIIFLHKKE